jgi:hypothetical protein
MTDDGRKVMAKAHIAFGKVSKKHITTYHPNPLNTKKKDHDIYANVYKYI